MRQFFNALVAAAAGGGGVPTFDANTANLDKASTHYFSVANNAKLQPTGDMTIAIWVKIDQYTVDDGIFGKWLSSGNLSYLLYSDGGTNNLAFIVFNGTTATQVNIPQPALGEWHLLIGKLDDEVLSVSLDAGTPVTVAHTGGITGSDTSDLVVGLYAPPGEGRNMDGSVGGPKIWNARAISGAEEIELFNLGKFVCWDDISTDLKDGSVFAPDLLNFDGNTGEELISRPHNIALQNDLVAVLDPVVTDDSAAGYAIDSVIWNLANNTSWICTDASVGAAVWVKTSLINNNSVPFDGEDLQVECA